MSTILQSSIKWILQKNEGCTQLLKLRFFVKNMAGGRGLIAGDSVKDYEYNTTVVHKMDFAEK